jgi:Domain of unknown function (DUF4277)
MVARPVFRTCGFLGLLRCGGLAAGGRGGSLLAVRQDAQFGSLSVEKLLGALPLVAGFSSRLRIRDIVDDACPVRDLAELTHGQVIEALVANRLTSSSPLVHVQSWARDWAVGEALGAEPELLNDDRIGRALDAIAPHLDQIAGSVGVAAIAAFGIDVTRLHWDMSAPRGADRSSGGERPPPPSCRSRAVKLRAV